MTSGSRQRAALFLILDHFCGEVSRDVVISRGELLQVGGGFRIPELLEASGARLREVGRGRAVPMIG